MAIALPSTSERLRQTLAGLLEEIDRTESVVRQRDEPDAVHDMRVAVRRLRATFRAV